MSAEYDEREARVALCRLIEPGDLRVASLVTDLGAVEVYRHLRDEREVGGLHSEVALRLRGLDARRDLEEAHRLGIRYVIPGDDEWPMGLDDLSSAEPVARQGGPPLGLWVRGRHLGSSCARSVALVGSRSATSYGSEVAYDVAAGVSAAGVSVISGAAFGIDKAGHRGALAAGGVTVAVLACGVDRVYPAAHAELIRYLYEHGVVASELAPGCAPMRMRFLARNRLIAALSRGTVVVEAAARSGALNTANWASRLHRPVMGVPGPVTSAPSEGVHELIRRGSATLVTRAEDVVEVISAAGDHGVALRRGEPRLEDELDELGVRILDALPVSRWVSLASLARTAGQSEAAVRQGLEELVSRGLAACDEGLWRLAPPTLEG